MKGKCIGYRLFLIAFIFHFYNAGQAQQKRSANPVYVDKGGVMRYTGSHKEAAFFGVNYTVPFAYGYRSHQALGVNLEKAIEADVYHFARLGFDAFRVHVWDTEITDSLGNLKENEHLRLFDYLVQQLKKRNIKILLTPLAFWGNGYPQRDSNTGSFSAKWNKEQVLVTEQAIKAQEAYLQQFLKHVNPYTKLTYEQDPDVIALEINNEPKHTGAKSGAAAYIHRMVAAVKKAGWTKPIFYNISESPAYADVVAGAPIEGVSFQWYPTGLVANRVLKGNYLPNVDQYRIPFSDTIIAFGNKAKAVYEFDAGDVWESYLYPAMARSFRTAGFQWATQFAYDPLATAYGNTEYQTHYLNLAYTPSKAISLLIASKAFHRLPKGKSYGAYPADTLFDVFRVSYISALSEMNTAQEFYYSNTTDTRPVNTAQLQHIAGVGSSPIIQYAGTGAYFLDRVEEGVWRLEVMPDAVLIRDPFEKASPEKEVARIQWQSNSMHINLPGLGSNFHVRGLNEGNAFNAVARNSTFAATPGTYLISSNKAKIKSLPAMAGTLGMQEFVAPQPFYSAPFASHMPVAEVSAGNAFAIKATVVGVAAADVMSIEIRNSVNQWKTLPLQKATAYDYTALVPADMVAPGVMNYRIIIKKRNGDFFVFPGNHKGDPYAWDAYTNDSWQTYVVPKAVPLVLFNAVTDRSAITLYNPDWRNNKVDYPTVDKPFQLVQHLFMNEPKKGDVLGWELFVKDKLVGRAPELTAMDKVVIRARLDSAAAKVKLALITDHAQAFVADVALTTNFQEIELPLSLFRQDSSLLLPRPYPGFMPLWFQPAVTGPLMLNQVEKLQLYVRAEETSKPVGIQVESIQLQAGTAVRGPATGSN